MDSVISVLITAGLGTWLAYVWQQRSTKQTRHFEASKTQHDLMRSAAMDLAALAGQRLYATHRICRISPANDHYEEAKESFRHSVLVWNEKHLQNDLNIRTLFVQSAVVRFEKLQNRLAALTNEVSRRLENVKEGDPPDYTLIRKAETLRGDFFSFLQGMIDEADSLFRQMHFGVRVKYDARGIRYYSTTDLLKTLFTGPEEASAITRAPSDFGAPVSIGDARLGVD